MKMWKRITQTLGSIWAPCLMGALLGTTGVLFIKLPISPTNDSTLGESIFGKKKNPKGGKRRVTSESDWKRYYGSCPELKDDIKLFGKECFTREILSLHRTPGRVNYEETRRAFSSRRSDGGT